MLNNNYGYACVNMQLAYPKQYGDSSESRIISHRTMVKKTLKIYETAVHNYQLGKEK